MPLAAPVFGWEIELDLHSCTVKRTTHRKIAKYIASVFPNADVVYGNEDEENYGSWRRVRKLVLKQTGRPDSCEEE